jgi:AcrR family transcriptional regulator
MERLQMDREQPSKVPKTTPRGSQTRARILAAAVKVAADHGVSGASVDEIAAVAAVAKGSLYYKDAIFEALLRDGFDAAGSAITTAAEGLEPQAALNAAALAILRFLRDNLDLTRVMATEVFRVDRPWEEALEPVRLAITVRLTQLIRAAHPDKRPVTEVAGASLFGALLGAALHWLRNSPDEPAEQVVGQLELLIGQSQPAGR